MKKIFCIWLFSVASLAVSEETEFIQEAHYGLIIGVNLASLTQNVRSGTVTTGTASLGSGAKFVVGFAFDAKVAPSLHIQPELKYVGRVGRDYLAIPFMIKGKFDTGIAVVPYLQFGPDLAFKISGTGETIDFALDLGGGFEIEMTPRTRLLIDLRYSFGITTATSTTAGTTVTSERNNGLLIHLGVLIKA